MSNSTPKRDRTWLYILAVLFALSVFVSGEIPQVLLFMVAVTGAYLLWNVWNNGGSLPFGLQAPQNNQRSLERDPRLVVADLASRQAGRDPVGSKLHLEDIGLLVYQGSDRARISRTTGIPTEATHIRPFMALNLPRLRGGTEQVVIRFNILNDIGQLRYTSRALYTVKGGTNFITPPTWLPLNDQLMTGDWSLQVELANEPFAVHYFNWFRMDNQERAQYNGDGELTADMRKQMERTARLRQDFGETLTLDDLLAPQEQSKVRRGQ